MFSVVSYESFHVIGAECCYWPFHNYQLVIDLAAVHLYAVTYSKMPCILNTSFTHCESLWYVSLSRECVWVPFLFNLVD